ncbi:MAG TPA: ATP-binding protein, partial [Caldimonas sp.]|nr:ATP-binding protein [Caldimonas sp.]
MPPSRIEPRPRRIAPLGRRLLLLVGAAIVPVALMSGFALHALWTQQKVQIRQSTVDLARALATSLDTELRLTVSALQTMALSPLLDAGDAQRLAQVRTLASQVLASRPEWRAVILARPSGEAIFATPALPGGELPTLVERDSFMEAVAQRRPTVGSLMIGPSGAAGIPVRVPVLRDGELRYILTAVVQPQAIVRLIGQQRIPDAWVVSVFDAKGERVARSRDQKRYFRSHASPSLQRLIAKMGSDAEIVGATTTLEGQDVYTAVSRLGVAPWTVALGEPTEIAGKALRDSGLAYGGGIAFSLGLGLLAAWLIARGIVGPIGRLRRSADALGRGEPLEEAASDVAEIEAVSKALADAARAGRLHEAERQRLLDAERDARAAAEASERRMHLLAGASALLSRSLEEETTLAAIASVIVPDVADVCRIDLLDAAGRLQRKLTHHSDPRRAEEIARFVARSTSSADTVGSFPWVIATGRSHLGNFDSPESVTATDPVFQEFIRTVGLCAICVVPLVARGRTIGVIAAIQAESHRSFDAEDAALVAELAQRAALALDNGRLYAESESARRHAEAASLAKDEFLAMLGHELRNPLAPIAASLELMDRRPAADAARERRIIGRQVAHLSRLVDDLLDVSRIASGKVELHRERIDLRDVVMRAVEQTQPVMRARASAPGLSLPDRPVEVSGDPLRLIQVVCNLLVNAAKYSPPDRPIRVEVESDVGTARLVVVDEGVGISAELLPRVFDRFVQGAQPLQRAQGGLGLGLAIARNLVDLHGGRIVAESGGAGRGSRFTVTLPLLAGHGSQMAPAAPATAPPHQPARVLIVDDNDDAAQSLAMLLGFEGHDVRVASDAEQGLAMLGDFDAQIAILDIGLPRMDGHALARALR